MTDTDWFDVASLCEAFQRTVARCGDMIALRTPGGAQEISWREYGDRVRRIATGFAALGVGPGDTVGIMLLNRPEFALVDTAALHLGAVPFSVYNTSSPEQISYLFGNAGNKIVITEQLFLPAIAAAGPGAEIIISLDGGAGTMALADLEGEAVVKLTGDLDIATAELAVSYVTDVIRRHREPLTVDLSALDFCDAKGLAALVRMAGFAEQKDRPFRLASPSSALIKIMRITGLDRRFSFSQIPALRALPPR